MPLGRICPGCHEIVVGPCPRGCRPGGKRLTPRRRRNQQVWASAAHRAQRLRVFARDGWSCVDCGWHDESESGRGLIADHRHGIDAVREFDDSELDTRCTSCSGAKDGQARR